MSSSGTGHSPKQSESIPHEKLDFVVTTNCTEVVIRDVISNTHLSNKSVLFDTDL